MAGCSGCRGPSSCTGPAIVVLELGANDGLRGLPLERMRANLAQMVQLSQAAGARVLLVGIRCRPNYGPRYGEQFAGVYPRPGAGSITCRSCRSCSRTLH